MKKLIKVRFVDLGGLGHVITNSVTKALCRNFDVMISDQPDVVFFSNYGHDYLDYSCVRVFISCENLPQISPYKCDFAIGSNQVNGCDWYFRWPYFRLAHDVDAFMQRRDAQCIVNESRCGVCIVVSNPMGTARNQFWSCMENRCPVASGGHYRNNVGGPVSDKTVFCRKHKFCIAFENSSSSGYLTEKLFDAWSAGCVPVYWGEGGGGDNLNPRAFINANNFGSWEKLADHVMEVDQSETLYRSYLEEPLFHDGLVPAELSDSAFVAAITEAIFSGHRLPHVLKLCQKYLRAGLVFRKKFRSLLHPKWYQ